MNSLTEKKNINLSKIELSRDETHHIIDGIHLYEKMFNLVTSYHPPGVAAVIDQTGAYHVNLEGEPIYQKRFIKTFGFYDGIAAVFDDSGWYHIDLDCEPQYNERYEWVGNFQEERCPVRDIKGNFFHIQKDGCMAYDEKYKYVGDYKYGIAVIYDKDGNARHIDKSGNLIHDKTYRELGVYHKGYATAKDKYGAFHVNKNGEPLYRQRYRWVEPFYNGFSYACKDNGEKIIINEQGEVIQEIYNQESPHIQNLLRSQLMGMLVGYWKTQIIHSIVELLVLEMIEAGHNTHNKLLEKSQLPAESLKMIIQVLIIWDFIMENEGVYELKHLGYLLTDSHPESLKYAALMWGEEHYQSMSKLTEALKYHKPQFDELFGHSIFQYYNLHKDKGLIFNKAIKAYALDYDNIIVLYDFSNTKVVLDIGGGTGDLLDKIMTQNKNIEKGFLLELPSVIENAKNLISKNVTRNKIEFISGDFFHKIDVKADTIVMSRILHDWKDDNASIILKNAHNALENDGKLLIFEMIVPEDPEHDFGVTLNFNLLVNVGGKERTLEEFKILLQKAGFTINSVKSGEGIISIIIAEKIK